eukprot:jgi/Orpsp1_1/1182580/evm.model.c7180000081888.1
MLNKNIFSILLFTLFNYTVIGITIMSKNEVLKIDIEKYKTKNDCPNYSTGFDENNNYCKFHFFCKNETCSTVDENGFVEFDNKTYKAYTCSFSESPLSRDISCYSDTECLSNNCYRGHCHRKNDMPRTECTVYRQYDNKASTHKPIMYCNKAENEHCDRDDECFSHTCLQSEENRTRYYCGPENYNEDENRLSDNYLYMLIIIILFIPYFIFDYATGGGICRGRRSGSGSGSSFYFSRGGHNCGGE